MPKWAQAGAAAAAVFAVVATALLWLMPEPVEAGDSLLAGSVATLVALLVLWFGLTPRSGGVFFKKRPKRR
jgi:hypothetical protein